MELRVNLPHTLANEAQPAGLLTPQAIERVLREAVRGKAVNELFETPDRLAAANVPPMTMAEIQAEVDRYAKPGASVRPVLDTNVVVSGMLWKGHKVKDREIGEGRFPSANLYQRYGYTRFEQQRAGNQRMPRYEEHRKAVCGRTACTV